MEHCYWPSLAIGPAMRYHCCKLDLTGDLMFLWSRKQAVILTWATKKAEVARGPKARKQSGSPRPL